MTANIKTVKGIFSLSFDEKRGLSQLRFPNSSSSSSSEKIPPNAKQIQKILDRYFLGKKISQFPQLTMALGTPFQQRVWQTLQKIPYGETRSYAWVAQQIGNPKAARAVGSACGKNPIPIFIPCHRVVATSGALGGFSCGLAWKKFLLKLEQN